MSEIKLYNDDALKILKEIPSESVDLFCSDIPYATTKRGGKSSNMGGYWNSDLVNKGKIFENNEIEIKDFISDAYRILKNKTHCYIMINNLNLIELLNEATKVGFHFIKLLIWDKKEVICGTYYMGQYEIIAFFRKGEGRMINNCGTSDILSISIHKLKDKNGNNLHNTEKPIKLMETLILNSTNEGDVVIDPFMGIGTTGIACKKNNRNFIGCEIDKKYFDIAEQRINGTFGKIYIDDEIFGL